MRFQLRHQLETGNCVLMIAATSCGFTRPLHSSPSLPGTSTTCMEWWKATASYWHAHVQPPQPRRRLEQQQVLAGKAAQQAVAASCRKGLAFPRKERSVAAAQAAALKRLGWLPPVRRRCGWLSWAISLKRHRRRHCDCYARCAASTPLTCAGRTIACVIFHAVPRPGI